MIQRNLYLILLVGLWPAIFFYFEVFPSEKQDLAYLLLGIGGLSLTLLLIFSFKNQRARMPILVTLLFLGFLSLRLIEFFVVGEEVDQLLEGVMHLYLTAAFLLSFAILVFKVSRNAYGGKTIAFIAVLFSLALLLLSARVSGLDYERQNLQDHVSRLFDAIALYESSPPEDWETYFDYGHSFSFKYPPKYTRSHVEESVVVSVEKVGQPEAEGDVLGLFWNSGCSQRLGAAGQKILLCKDENGETILFLREDRLVRAYVKNFPRSKAEFNAIVNSFKVY